MRCLQTVVLAAIMSVGSYAKEQPIHWNLFACLNSENKTFTIQEMCDGRDACGDSSDECRSMCDQNFHCADQQSCLALDRFCDGEVQCSDGSDEMEVDKNVNSDDRFYCHNYWTDEISLPKYRRNGTRVFDSLSSSKRRQCYLPKVLVCDGVNHCGDHSDECNEKCRTERPEAYFICDNGNCIAARHRCNDIDDCGDGSDECIGCPSSFKCPDGTCIAASKFCDGHKDCQDGSDELRPTENISNSTKMACKSALNYATEECLVPRSYVCDGYEQCLQREDECGAECSEYSFLCGNGKCIISVNKCNGIDDCGDMTDECNAECKNTFLCSDGSCISLDKFCDGHADCGDGSDEIFMQALDDSQFASVDEGLYCANGLLPSSERICLLPKQYMCDGYPHCYDRVDECQVGCTKSFLCDGGDTCIERKQVCDGKHQCKDGQDEPKQATSLNNLRGFKCYTSKFGLTKPCVLPQVMVNDSVSDCEEDIDVCSLLDGNGSISQQCWKCVSNPDVIISKKQVCDGEFDCPDLSDECLCRDVNATAVCQHTCFGTYWNKNCMCPSGQLPCLLPDVEILYPIFCITFDKFCDGTYHCPNKADEVSCGRSDVCASSSAETSSPTTPPYIFERKIPNHCRPNYTCPVHMEDNIWTPKKAVSCDGKPECFDLEDECGPQCDTKPDFCNYRKEKGYYVCPEGGVQPGLIICDGLKNCSESGQDEINCPGRFYCTAGEVVSIENYRRCDFEVDCLDASDEANCTNTHFYCETGKPYFVKIREKFDGKNDCEDGSDECPENSFEKSIFSSKENLIENPFLKGMVWVMGLLSIIGNSFVMFNTVRSLSQQTKKMNNVAVIFNFLVFNLAVADLLMGFFLILLGVKDSMLSGKYCREDKGWRTGNMCKILGVMATISSETSIIILGILSSYRLLCVVQPVKGRNLHLKSAAILMAITWTATVTVAILPICPPLADYFVTSAWLAPNPFFLEDVVYRDDMEIFTKIVRGYMSNKTEYVESLSWQSMSETLLQLDPNYITLGYFGYFSTHAVCLPKIFVKHNDTSWEYSVMLTVFNFTMFVYIVMAYIRVSRPNPIQGTRRKNSSSSTTATRNMQRRIAMLVATDFACWVPTCMIGFVQLGGVPVGPTVYALAAIVLLPINSALNPILYSDSTQNACFKLIGAFSSLKCKIRGFYSDTEHIGHEEAHKLTTTSANNTLNTTLSHRPRTRSARDTIECEMETML